MNLFFVFGALDVDQPHFFKIVSLIRREATKPAKIRGTAYRLRIGYPICTEEGDDWISGHLIEGLDQRLGLTLDEMFNYMPDRPPERSYFLRQRVMVQRSEGGEVCCWSYRLKSFKLPRDAKKIPNGEWLADLRDRLPVATSLSRRELEFLCVIGSGGDLTVPLTVYRGLKEKELIVDRNRQPVLTKLGQDVYRFLL